MSILDKILHACYLGHESWAATELTEEEVVLLSRTPNVISKRRIKLARSLRPLITESMYEGAPFSDDEIDALKQYTKDNYDDLVKEGFVISQKPNLIELMLLIAEMYGFIVDIRSDRILYMNAKFNSVVMDSAASFIKQWQALWAAERDKVK